jgi:hypothetical protein
MKRGNVIASSIAFLWGLGILIANLAGMAGSTSGSGSYNAGHSAGMLFALVLGAAGARGLFKELRRARGES